MKTIIEFIESSLQEGINRLRMILLKVKRNFLPLMCVGVLLFLFFKVCNQHDFNSLNYRSANGFIDRKTGIVYVVEHNEIFALNLKSGKYWYYNMKLDRTLWNCLRNKKNCQRTEPVSMSQ